MKIILLSYSLDFFCDSGYVWRYMFIGNSLLMIYIVDRAIFLYFAKREFEIIEMKMKTQSGWLFVVKTK